MSDFWREGKEGEYCVRGFWARRSAGCLITVQAERLAALRLAN